MKKKQPVNYFRLTCRHTDMTRIENSLAEFVFPVLVSSLLDDGSDVKVLCGAPHCPADQRPTAES